MVKVYFRTDKNKDGADELAPTTEVLLEPKLEWNEKQNLLPGTI